MKWPQRRRRGLLHQRHSSFKQNERPVSKQWTNHRFDETTGQIYTEQIASILSADDRDWTRRTQIVRGPDFQDVGKYAEKANSWEKRRTEGLGGYQELPQVRRLGGARSLQNIALESVLQNILDITPESIKYLPPQLIGRIWEVVSKRCNVSFDTWATFSKFLHREDRIQPELMRYAQAIPSPRLPLVEYTTPLISTTFDFLASLSITITTTYPVPDLVQLSTIRNLGVLEIINTDGMKVSETTSDFQFGVGDRLIRAWNLAARSEQAFPVLRVLRLWNHDNLTSQSLVYLNGFPSLAVYDVKDCGFDKDSKSQARSLGWKPCFETNILELLEDTCDKRTAFIQAQSGGVATTIPEKESKHTINRIEVTRIPRAQLSTFMISRQFPKPTQKSKKAKADLATAQKEDDRQHEFGRNKRVESWESAACKAYARIGELRNDTDLIKAGVTTGDQATTIGNELICSIPIASVRLGQAPSTRTSSRALSFIRIKAPSVEAVPKEEALRSVSQVLVQVGNNESTMGSIQLAPGKRRGTGMMKSKKRMLDEVLNSFF